LVPINARYRRSEISAILNVRLTGHLTQIVVDSALDEGK
jgi:hypothetical protein